MRVSRVAGWLVALIMVASAAACGVGGDDDESSATTEARRDRTTTTEPDEDPSEEPSEEACTPPSTVDADGACSPPPEDDPEVQELASDIETVTQRLNAFYAERIDDYAPPVDTIAFISDQGTLGPNGEVGPFPRCGEEEVKGENAFFCPPDNTVILAVDYMLAQQTRIGDAFTYMALAHEYGHSAQFNLDAPRGDNTELQADCYAGGFIQSEIDAGTIILEEGDEEEINLSLSVISNPFGSDEFHGTLAQRASAFEFGRTNGVTACQSEYA